MTSELTGVAIMNNLESKEQVNERASAASVQRVIGGALHAPSSTFYDA
jgi:hypothetical protein